MMLYVESAREKPSCCDGARRLTKKPTDAAATRSSKKTSLLLSTSAMMMKISAPPALLSILLRGSASAFAPSFKASTPTLVGKSRATTRVVPSSSLAFSSSSNFIYGLRGGSGSSSGTSSSSSSSELNTMSAERPFVTWTFDRHCETMDWSPAPAASLSAVSAATAVDGLAVGDADLVIVGVFAPPAKDDDDGDKDDEKKEMDPIVFNGKARELDEMLGGALTELASDNSKAFQNGGSAGTLTPAMRVAVPGGKAKRYVLLGLGPEGKEKDGVTPKVESATITKAASAVASACHDQKKVKSCNVLLPPQIVEGISSSGMLTDFSTGFFSSLYVDNRYRTGKKVEIKAEDVESVKLYLELSDGSDYDAAISSGAAIAMGCSLTKDIVNAPHNVLNSESLAETAKRVAEESGGSITCEILGKEECEARGMGAYLGVARGSETEPQFIHLTYKPPSGEIK